MKDLSLLEIDKYLRSFVNVEADLKRIDGFTVYRVKDLANKSADESIFAIIKNNSKPVLLDLACEKHLAKLLRTKYETISPSKINNPREWNQIICSGQMTVDEVKDLIVLAYNLTSSN